MTITLGSGQEDLGVPVQEQERGFRSEEQMEGRTRTPLRPGDGRFDIFRRLVLNLGVFTASSTKRFDDDLLLCIPYATSCSEVLLEVYRNACLSTQLCCMFHGSSICTTRGGRTSIILFVQLRNVHWS